MLASQAWRQAETRMRLSSLRSENCLANLYLIYKQDPAKTHSHCFQVQLDDWLIIALKRPAPLVFTKGGWGRKAMMLLWLSGLRRYQEGKREMSKGRAQGEREKTRDECAAQDDNRSFHMWGVITCVFMYVCENYVCVCVQGQHMCGFVGLTCVHVCVHMYVFV